MSDFVTELEALLKTDKKLEAVSAITASKNRDEIIPTGLLPFDIVAGGGISRGTIISIYGPRSAGKSTLTDSICAAWTKSSPYALIYRVESERCMDPERLSRIGVDIDRVRCLANDKALVLEDCFDQIKAFQDLIYGKYGDKVPVLIVWDTISMASSRSEVEGDKWASGMMADARIIKQGMKELNARCASYKHSAIILNQVMQAGKNRITGQMQYAVGGGEAMQHIPSMIIEVSRSTSKDRQIYNPNPADPKNPEIIGSEVDIKLRKNKLTGLDNRSVSLVMYMTSGMSKLDSLVLYATDSGTCKKYFSGAGAWIQIYDHNGNEYKKINGKAKLGEEIKNDPYLMKLIEYAGYKFYADQDPLYAAKYKDILEKLSNELDSLLKDKNSVKVDMSGLEDLKLPENFGELGDSNEDDEEIEE
jgi:RecA/RadA recombinase